VSTGTYDKEEKERKTGAKEKNLPPGRMEHGASSCPPSCPPSLPASAGDKRVGGGEAVMLPPWRVSIHHSRPLC